MRGNSSNNLAWLGGAVVAVVVTASSSFISAPATAVTEKVLYAFKGGSDGAGPDARLLDVKGTLYGTTYSGGTGPCTGGCGTVFSIEP